MLVLVGPPEGGSGTQPPVAAGLHDHHDLAQRQKKRRPSSGADPAVRVSLIVGGESEEHQGEEEEEEEEEEEKQNQEEEEGEEAEKQSSCENTRRMKLAPWPWSWPSRTAEEQPTARAHLYSR